MIKNRHLKKSQKSSLDKRDETSKNKNKKMINVKTQANYLNLGNFGWRYYNSVKKKAMEQEFSWSGLILSLSIAFFIVIACAQGLSMVYQSIETTRMHRQTFESGIYQLEENIRVDLSKESMTHLVLEESQIYNKC